MKRNLFFKNEKFSNAKNQKKNQNKCSKNQNKQKYHVIFKIKNNYNKIKNNL